MRLSTVLLSLGLYSLTLSVAFAHNDNDTIILPIVNIIDGDTIKVDYNVLPVPLNIISIRILKIDTPEKTWRGKCDREKKLGVEATRYLTTLVGDETHITIRNFGYGSYGGRLVAEVYVNGVNLGDAMVLSGYAKYYDYRKGKKGKPDWCN